MFITDTPHLIAFFFAAILLLAIPGPAVLYVIARSVDQGRLAGIVSVLGIGLGTVVHVAAAAFGISAILMTSALAFNILKYAGAAYLIYIGVKKLLEKQSDDTIEIHVPPQKLSRIFFQGALVNILNPKTALFFFAFLPQFVSPGQGTIQGQMLFLGICFVFLGIFSDSIYALVASGLRSWLKGNKKVQRRQNKFSAVLYIILGLLSLAAKPVKS